jgi:hypothetical protein
MIAQTKAGTNRFFDANEGRVGVCPECRVRFNTGKIDQINEEWTDERQVSK